MKTTAEDNLKANRTRKAICDDLAKGLLVEVDASAVVVVLLDERKQFLNVMAAKPDGALPNIEKVALRLDDPTSATAQAVRMKLPITVKDVARERLGKKWLAGQYPQKSVMAVPIIAEDEAIGAAVVIEMRRERQFTAEEQVHALSRASEAGTALTRSPDAERRKTA